MKTAVLIAFLALTASLSFGQTPVEPAYKVRARKGGVAVTFQRKAHRLDLAGRIDAAKVKSVELIFGGEKDGFRYLLIDVSGDSRDGNYDRQCGAGTESNLIWLKLDAAWAISDAKSVRYQSCWSGIELNEPIKITKTTLAMTFDNVREDVTVTLFYNAEEPEQGLRIAEAPTKAQ
ncbi:MAG TPA: hypothetical protein VIL74_17565 [Pyrinomonadaceae bacterium]|jgi:hypothetical protein